MRFTITRRDGFVFLIVDSRLVAAVSESAWSFALANATVVEPPDPAKLKVERASA